MQKILEGKELEQRCRELGIDTQGPPRNQSASGNTPRASDSELQRRLIEAERSIREKNLWKLAFVSAVASVLSAVAAVIAAFVALHMSR